MTICQPAVWRGRQGGIRPCSLDPGPLAYADCREGPELRAALHRPGATRHPWRDAPSPGHPDRSPATCTPSLGPADGLGLGRKMAIVFDQPSTGGSTGHGECLGRRLVAERERSPTFTASALVATNALFRSMVHGQYSCAVWVSSSPSTATQHGGCLYIWHVATGLKILLCMLFPIIIRIKVISKNVTMASFRLAETT
jgi:hypothetical protein